MDWTEILTDYDKLDVISLEILNNGLVKYKILLDGKVYFINRTKYGEYDIEDSMYSWRFSSYHYAFNLVEKIYEVVVKQYVGDSCIIKKCDCGANYTSNPAYHYEWCSLKK